MWTELKYCSEGDYIKATFLGNVDPSNPNDLKWHKIYRLEQKDSGKYYVAIEGWKGDEVYGTEDVFVDK